MKTGRQLGVNLALTAVIAVFLVSFLVGVKNLSVLHRVDRDEFGHVIWISTQLERDYLKLLVALDNHAHRNNRASRRELERRTAGLHSRLQLFREGAQGTLLSAIPETHDVVTRLNEMLAAVESDIAALADGEIALAPILIERLGSLESNIHRAVIAGFRQDSAFAGRLDRDFERFALLSAVSLLGILASGAALIVLSIGQARRAKRAEQLSAQARGEAEDACQRAENASRAKSAFLAQMSHELRTPLNAILGFSEVVQRQPYGPVGDERYSDYAGYIHSSGNHLLSLIDDILDLSRVEAGKYELRIEAVDFRELVESELAFIADFAKAKRLSVNADLSGLTKALLVDRRALRQVLLNLLSNAIKYTPAGGEVLISGQELPNAGVAFSVSDNGEGIAPENIAKVLEPFGRLQDPLTQSQEGCGLGLSITKRLVELHDGKLLIASRPGGGTIVTVELPAERVQWAANAA